ncbi:MAG TPA: lanthionine synthetase C family protein [Thermoanaerobaculia bacterium]|jgi:lantibiotic modifying enzyme|nr:lanthionine synthetase C family protein [Thermoanaerobaculia bacterium]
MPWQPLLEGATSAAAAEAVRSIAGALQQERPVSLGPSYAYGHSGLALFYGYLSIANGEESFEELAVSNLDQAADALSDSPCPLGLFLGLAGSAWASRHLDELLTGTSSAETTEEVDELIAEAVRVSPWRGDYDLVSGLAGLGFYALDHPDRKFAGEVIDQILRRLEELALERDGGLTWWTSPALMAPDTAALYPDGYLNLGVAHGVPGVIGMLGQACARGIEEARRLLDGAVAWLLANRRPDDGGSSFTSYISPSDRAGSATGCQSAWCYGDAGVAAVLLSAARSAGEPAWEREALAIARRDCAAPPPEAVGTTFCHGAPGLGHLYNRLFQATDEEVFADAARGWFERALADLARNPERGEEFVRFGIQEGMAGIGLALLAATSPVPPDWDRPFLFGV